MHLRATFGNCEAATEEIVIAAAAAAAAEKRGCYVDNDLISLLGSIVVMAEMTRII